MPGLVSRLPSPRPWKRWFGGATGPTSPAKLEDLFLRLLSLAPEAAREAVLAHQRQCWEAGTPQAAEIYLRHLKTQGAEESLAVEVIQQEIHLRAERGETPPYDEYLERFPAHESALRELWAGDQTIAHEPVAQQAVEENLEGHTLEWPASAETVTVKPAPAQFPAGYEILRELGRGGMGIVYLARKEGSERLVALKLLKPGKPRTPRWQSRLRREAQALALLKHPTVVQLHADGTEEDVPFLAVEYIPGESLTSRLRQGALAPRRAAALVRTLARGLQDVHLRGVIHRDLKPANILIDKDNQPRIIDFGLAQGPADTNGTITGPGVVVGTPGYMSPEQANGQYEQHGPTTDVFGLGVILYEALTGRPPHVGADWRVAW